MSGETEEKPSSWTVDSLFYHFRDKINDLVSLLNERKIAQDTAVQAALSAAKEAVIKAEAASEKRFEGVNEFRAALSDQTNTFMPRAEAESRFSTLEEKVGAGASTDAANQGYILALKGFRAESLRVIAVLISLSGVIVTILLFTR